MTLVRRALLAALPGALCVAVFAATGPEAGFRFGIEPRVTHGAWWLLTLLLWPFIHFSWPHVLKNAALLTAAVFLHLRDMLTLGSVWCYSQAVAGGLVWLAGRSGSVHAGASGVSNALLSSLLLQRLIVRRVSLPVAAAAVAACGSLAVAAEAEAGVSSEGHLFGYLCGVLATAALAWRRQQQQQKTGALRSAEEIV